MAAKFKTTEKGTQLPLLNLKGKDYLQVAHRLVWFREVYPKGVIKTAILHNQDNGAIVKAEIYSDASGGLLASAHKSESKEHFGDYIEKAETGAIGRALAMAGFGTQFDPEFDEGMRLADSPIDPVVKAATTIKTTGLAAPNVILPEVEKAHANVARPSFRKKVETKTEAKVEDDI